jgi:crotonobetainyl-CoA:carnitine CoA-transferase CaiB-like acyl-CoA transferase
VTGPGPALTSGPLAGVKVIDLSAVVSGPMCAGLLADQGADVIKVETPQGDLTRVIGPAKGDITSLFASLNRGKRSIVLDLKQAEAQAVLRGLLEQADVLIENFRPGALARLGFGFDAVAALNPRLVYLSISGYGPSGPYAGQRVYDTVIQAVAGVADAHPHPETGEPLLQRTLVCDKVTALTAAQAVTAALYERDRAAERGGSGRGQLVQLAMLDATVAFLWPEAFYNHGFLDQPPAPVPEYGATLRLWRASDGWFSLVTPQDDEFAAMCRAFDCTELIVDVRFVSIPARRVHQQALRAMLEPVVAAQPVDALAAAAWPRRGRPPAGCNTKAGPERTTRRCATTALLVDTEHPGLGRLRSPRMAARFGAEAADGAAGTAAGMAAEVQLPRAPHQGEHSRAILRELGRSEAQIDALLASRAVR